MLQPNEKLVESGSTVKKLEGVVVLNNAVPKVISQTKPDNCDSPLTNKTETKSLLCAFCGLDLHCKCQIITESTFENPRSGNCQTAIDDELSVLNKDTWRCQFCEYNDNIMNIAICVICSRTNDKFVCTRKSVDTEYYHLLELEESDNFIPNFEHFECPICTEIIEPNNGVQLRGCLHCFCQTCIRIYIRGLDQPEIPCPTNICTNILEDREIKTLISNEEYIRYLEISLRIGKAKITNGYQCCVADCKGWWIFTEGLYDYNCPACGTRNCISCRASHPGISCSTYEENKYYYTDENAINTRQVLEDMLTTSKAEHCPNCNIIVEKIDGCAKMHCTMCRTDFTWTGTAATLNIK